MSLVNHPRAPFALRKRNGQQVRFDHRKILHSIAAAGEVSREFGTDIAVVLANIVLVRLLDRDALSVEDVRDTVERELMEAGFHATARAFINYHPPRQPRFASAH